ncbi:MAG TPA: hypothetical protein VH796_01465 [Nitrososphaeraceae archaeon]
MPVFFAHLATDIDIPKMSEFELCEKITGFEIKIGVYLMASRQDVQKQSSAHIEISIK